MPCLCRLHSSKYNEYEKQISLLIHDIALILRAAHKEGDSDLLQRVRTGIDHAFHGSFIEKDKPEE